RAEHEVSAANHENSGGQNEQHGHHKYSQTKSSRHNLPLFRVPEELDDKLIPVLLQVAGSSLGQDGSLLHQGQTVGKGLGATDVVSNNNGRHAACLLHLQNQVSDL